MLHILMHIIILKFVPLKNQFAKTYQQHVEWNGMGETLPGAQAFCQWVTLIDR